jgi:hypothetical protein
MDQQAITDLILGVVQDKNRDQATIAKAVQQLSEQATASAAEIGDFIWDVFNAVFDVSAKIDVGEQAALVDFLEALRQVDVAGADGKTLKHEGGQVWKDLPTFGWVARDLWNFGRFPFLDFKPSAHESQMRPLQCHPRSLTSWSIGPSSSPS